MCDQNQEIHKSLSAKRRTEMALDEYRAMRVWLPSDNYTSRARCLSQVCYPGIVVGSSPFVWVASSVSSG
jgi:hypothetical protein